MWGAANVSTILRDFRRLSSSEGESTSSEDDSINHSLTSPLVPLEAVLSADMLFEALAMSHDELTEYLSKPITLLRLVDLILKPEQVLSDPARRIAEITQTAHRVHITETELLRTPAVAQDLLCAACAGSLHRVLVTEHKLMSEIWSGVLLGNPPNEERLSFFHRFIPVVAENCPAEFKAFLDAKPERIWDWFRLLSARSMAELLRDILLVPQEMFFNAEAIIALLLCCLGAPFHSPFPFLQRIDDSREFIDLHTHAVLLLRDIVQTCESQNRLFPLFSQSLISKQSISFLFFIIAKALATADNLILDTVENDEFPKLADEHIAALRLPSKECIVAKSTVNAALDVLGLICSFSLDTGLPNNVSQKRADGVLVERPTGDEPLCDPMEDDDDMIDDKATALIGFENLRESINDLASKHCEMAKLIGATEVKQNEEILTTADSLDTANDDKIDQSNGQGEQQATITIQAVHIMEAASLLEAAEEVPTDEHNSCRDESTVCYIAAEAILEVTEVIETAQIIDGEEEEGYHLLLSSSRLSPSVASSSVTSQMYFYLAFGCDAKDLLMPSRQFIAPEEDVVENYAVPRMNLIAALIERYAEAVKSSKYCTTLLLELLRLLKLIVRASNDPSSIFTISLLKALVVLLFDGSNNLVHIAITEVLQAILAPKFAQKFDSTVFVRNRDYQWTQEVVRTLLMDTDLLQRAASLVFEMRVLATSSATFVEKRKSALQTAPQAFHALHLVQLILYHHNGLRSRIQMPPEWPAVEEVVAQFADLLSKPLGGVVPEGFLSVAEQRLSILPLGLCVSPTSGHTDWDKPSGGLCCTPSAASATDNTRWDTYEIALDMLESLAEDNNNNKWDQKNETTMILTLPPPGAGLLD